MDGQRGGESRHPEAKTKRNRSPGARIGVRSVAVIQSILLVATTSCVPGEAGVPEPGVLDYQAPLIIDAPDARVNLAGGNLVHRRVDLTLDSLFGPLEVGATYNSATGQWLWPFDMTYDGSTFVDDSGALHDLSSVADGSAIPGTHWVKLDANTIKTKGGLAHHFSSASHRLLSITGLHSLRPALVFFFEWIQGSKRTTTVSQCREVNQCRLVYSIEYDQNACVSEIADRAGRRVLLTNDPDCRPLVVRDPLDVARGWPGRRYLYESELLVAITNSEGERVAYGYAGGRLASIRRVGEPGEVVYFHYGFDPFAQRFLTLVDDPRGGRSIYRYDAEKRLHEVQDAVGDITRMTWLGLRPSSRVGPAGATTRWLFEADDAVRVELPSGNVVEYEYASGAQHHARPRESPIARITDSLGLVEARTYDAWGFPARTTNGAGDTRWSSYDEEGMLRMSSEASGPPTYWDAYGEHGHAETVLRAGKTYRRVFDAVGNLLEGPDMRAPAAPGRPGFRSRTFDEDRNLASLELVGESDTNPPGEEVQSLIFSHRSDGRLLGITRPYGGDTVFEYDTIGRLVGRGERVDGAWRFRSYEYSPGGDLRAAALPNGMRSEVVRDLLGRPIRLIHRRGGVVEQSASLVWNAGRLEHLMDASRPGLESFVHDVAGRVISTRYPEGEMLLRTYDLRSREISREFLLAPGSEPLRSIAFSYDLADRETQIFDQGELVVDRRFDGGRPDEIAYGNGLVRSFEYESQYGVLDATQLKAPGGAFVASTDLQWSECHEDFLCLSTFSAANLTVGEAVLNFPGEEHYVLGPRADIFPEFGGYGSRLRAWDYDAMEPGNMGSGVVYSFDPLGNWLGVWEGSLQTSRFIFNAERNRLIGSDLDIHHDYAWDEAGFMTARDSVALTWSAAGKLTEVGASVALAWDTLGRPISTTSSAGEARFLFAGMVIGDANRQPLSLDLGDVEIALTDGGRLYRHDDFRGNVQLVSDQSGDLLEFNTYSPFGVDQARGSSGNDRSFARGAELAGFLVLGARVYDPEVGRFISPDPFYHPVGQFAYTLGNPVAFWDPGGRSSEISPMMGAMEVARDAAQTSGSLGASVVVAALAFKSAPLALLGIGFFLLAGIASLVKLYSQFRAARGGQVLIEDLPEGTGATGVEAIGSGSGVASPDIVACSPLALGSQPGLPWAAGLVVPLQMLLAGLVIAWFRRRGR